MFDLTLTFDNGPEPEATPGVLDVLARRGIKTTFFVIGDKLNRPEGRKLAERAHAEGHWIGNHSWTHSVPLGQRKEADIAEFEIGRTQAAMAGLIHPHRYLPAVRRRRQSRPAPDVAAGGRLSGARPLYMRVVEFDPARLGRSRRLGRARAFRNARSQPWTLMVLHDLPTGAMRHLDAFLDKVGEAGGRIRQDFPPDCMPIVDGAVVRPIDDYVAAA